MIGSVGMGCAGGGPPPRPPTRSGPTPGTVATAGIGGAIAGIIVHIRSLIEQMQALLDAEDSPPYEGGFGGRVGRVIPNEDENISLSPEASDDAKGRNVSDDEIVDAYNLGQTKTYTNSNGETRIGYFAQTLASFLEKLLMV
jgi:hypothetical protein